MGEACVGGTVGTNVAKVGGTVKVVGANAKVGAKVGDGDGAKVEFAQTALVEIPHAVV